MTDSFISDDGKYVAVPAPGLSPAYDILLIEGGLPVNVWLWPRYEAEGRNDTNPRFVYPEFPRMGISWSNKGMSKGKDRFTMFEMGFADLDITKKIDPLTGNTIIAQYTATFRKRIRLRRSMRLKVAVAIQNALEFKRA